MNTEPHEISPSNHWYSASATAMAAVLTTSTRIAELPMSGTDRREGSSAGAFAAALPMLDWPPNLFD